MSDSCVHIPPTPHRTNLASNCLQPERERERATRPQFFSIFHVARYLGSLPRYMSYGRKYMFVCDTYLNSLRQVERPADELQVLGGTCLFIASKLREATPISVDSVVECGAYSYSIRDVRVSDQLCLPH